MRVIREQIISGLVSQNEDEVIAFAPIPPGGKVLSVTGELHMIAPENFPIRQFTGYGVSGYVEPVVDPDGNITLDVLWDNMVTKPSAVTTTAGIQQVDWDFDTGDTGPDVEVGQMDLNRAMGLASPGKVLMTPHLEMLSWAKSRQGGWHAETGETDQFNISDYKTFRINQTIAAPESMPAYAMIGVSIPLFDIEQVSHSILGGSGAAKQWAILGNLRNAMGDFWRMQTGLAEAGAESPYLDVSLAIEDLVAPPITMPTTATIVSVTPWTYMCKATWVLDYPDSFIPGTLAAHAG